MSPDRRRFLQTVAGAVMGGSTALASGRAFLQRTMRVLDGAPERPLDGAPERPLDVALFFDVEDIFSPPGVGNDDSIKELADILTEAGLRGNFLFIGDRALLLRSRGRGDVIESLSPHEVGLHTRSARHPTNPEFVAGKSWDEGVALSLADERAGAEIIRDVFGKPCAALSGHNVFDSPHRQRAAALLGLPDVYPFPAAPPLYNLSWYAGALVLPFVSPTLDDQPFRAYFQIPDPAYHSNERFETELRRLDEHIDLSRQEGQPYLTLFLFHPQRLRLVDYIDHFWSPNGVNLPSEQWGKFGQPRRRTPQEVETALANFRRLARWLRHDPRLNIMTVAEVAAKYGQQPSAIRREELIAVARTMATADEIVHLPRISPAEAVVGLARLVIHHADRDEWPATVPRDDVLGPTASPISVPELQGCTHDALIGFARGIVEYVERTGHLPSSFGPPLDRVGINHLYCALAETVVALDADSRLTEVRFRRMPSGPPLGAPIGLQYMTAVEGELMRPDVNGHTLYRDGKLQTWSLKPAIVPDA